MRKCSMMLVILCSLLSGCSSAAPKHHRVCHTMRVQLDGSVKCVKSEPFVIVPDSTYFDSTLFKIGPTPGFNWKFIP